MTEIEITKEVAAKVLSVVDQGLSHGLGNPTPGNMCVEAAVCYALGMPHGDNPSCVSPAVRALKIRLNDSQWSSKAARAKGMRRLAIAQLGSADTINDTAFSLRVVDYVLKTTLPRSLRNLVGIELFSPEIKASLEAAAVGCETADESAASAESAARSAASAASAAWSAASAASAAWSAARSAAWSAARSAARSAASAAWSAASAAESAAESAESAARSAASAAWSAARSAASAESAARSAASAAQDKELSIFAEGIVQILIEMKAPGCEFLSLTEAD